MNFTREDVLRELELLPVWKLRAPLTTEVKAGVNIELKQEIHAETLPFAAEPVAYFCVVSDDKKWAFIWPASLVLSASQSTLFDNILVALKITKSHRSEITSVEHIATSVIILMGEIVAQKVLSTTEPIETLRGKTHLLKNVPAIVTYHPSDMLDNLQLKPKTWEDLCLAMRILSA